MSDARERLVKKMKRANMLRWNMLNESGSAKSVLVSRDEVPVLAA